MADKVGVEITIDAECPTLPTLKPIAAVEGDDSAVVEQCIETLRKAESFSGSLDDYPFVDRLRHDQWRQFMWIHAAHHLGFLAPRDHQHEEPG